METIDPPKSNFMITVERKTTRLSQEDEMWLNSRGGLDWDDVGLDEQGRKFILMWTPDKKRRVNDDGEGRVYLPTTYLARVVETPGFIMNGNGELGYLV